jgi:hypothetical protein
MAQIFPRNFAGNISLGDVTVAVSNYSSGELSEDYEELENNTSKTVPAGAVLVRVENTGLGDITVGYDGNTRTIGPAGIWEKKAYEDASTKVSYKLKAVLVTIPDGGDEPNSANVSVERGA